MSTHALFAVFFLLIPLVSFAQGAPAASPTPEEGKKGEVLVLSPFEVKAEDDGSYIATNTLAGTRLNSELKDVPASLSVMTADFIRDIGAMNLAEAMEYTVGAEQDFSDTTGNNRQSDDLQLRMRGFRNSTIGRNYFESQTAQDNYNTERLTFARGPNSVIFGSGGAGGVADASTKRAQQKNITALTTRIGPYDDYRAEIDINRPITKKLAFRVNTLIWNKKGWRDHEFQNRKSAALAATWKPFEQTTIRFDGEIGKIDQLKPQPWTVFDAVSPWIDAGRPISQTFGAAVPGTGAFNTATKIFISNSGEHISLRNSRATSSVSGLSELGGARTAFKDESIAPFSFYPMGPGATSNSEFRTAGIFIEQRLFNNLYIEVAANHQNSTRDWNRPMLWSGAQLLADPNARRPDGSPNPYVGQYYIESGNATIQRQNQTANDYRLTGSYRLDLGRAGRHQFAVLTSRRDSFNRNSALTEAWLNNPAVPAYNNNANNIIRRTYVSFDPTNSLGLSSSYQNPYDTPVTVGGVQSGFYYSNKLNQHNQFNSRLGVLQSYFFSDRLVTTVGLRGDEQLSQGSTVTRDPVTQEVLYATRNDETTEVSGNTLTAGAVYHVKPWLSLAVNTSSNATPQNFIAVSEDAENRNIPLGNREGEGRDYSARVRLFGGKVHGAVTYYETDEVNSQRFKAGNETSGWLLWLNQAYISLNKPGASVSPNYITGEDTVDITSHGWETEWVVNVTKQLRFTANASKSTVLGSNQWPRLTALATPLIAEMRANPSLPVAGVGGRTTLGSLADLMESQMVIDQRTSGKQVINARPYSTNLFVNYRFLEGRLKGLATSVGVQLRGRRVVGYNSTTYEPVMDGDYTQINGSITYQRPLKFGAHKVQWRVSLNGTNIFGNRKGLLPIVGDETGIDRFAFETTPTVFLTNRFEF